MIRAWVWFLPCWVWKCFFGDLPKLPVRLDGQPRNGVRLDREFILVYHPQAETEWLRSKDEGVEPQLVRMNGASTFVGRENLLSDQMHGG